MGATDLKTGAAALAALMIVGGCSPAPKGGGPADQFAGLDGEILKWRGEIIAHDPLCASKAEGQTCVDFEVACKAQRTVTAADQAKGVTGRVVAAISWNGFDAKFKQAQRGAKTAEFAKAASGWTRTDHAPVSMSTCADL